MSAIESAEPMCPTCARLDCSMINRRTLDGTESMSCIAACHHNRLQRLAVSLIRSQSRTSVAQFGRFQRRKPVRRAAARIDPQAAPRPHQPRTRIPMPRAEPQRWRGGAPAPRGSRPARRGSPPRRTPLHTRPLLRRPPDVPASVIPSTAATGIARHERRCCKVVRTNDPEARTGNPHLRASVAEVLAGEGGDRTPAPSTGWGCQG